MPPALLDNAGAIIPDELRKQGDAPPASTMVIATKLASKNLLEHLHECKRAQGGEGGIPLPELLGFMRQAADALDYLNAPQHVLGDRKVSIQHRDIKPENILLAANTVGSRMGWRLFAGGRLSILYDDLVILNCGPGERTL